MQPTPQPAHSLALSTALGPVSAPMQARYLSSSRSSSVTAALPPRPRTPPPAWRARGQGTSRHRQWHLLCSRSSQVWWGQGLPLAAALMVAAAAAGAMVLLAQRRRGEQVRVQLMGCLRARGNGFPQEVAAHPRHRRLLPPLTVRGEVGALAGQRPGLSSSRRQLSYQTPLQQCVRPGLQSATQASWPRSL